MRSDLDLRKLEEIARDRLRLLGAEPGGIEIGDDRRHRHRQVGKCFDRLALHYLRRHRPAKCVLPHLRLASPAVAVDVAVVDPAADEGRRVRLRQVVGGESAAEILERIEVELLDRGVGIAAMDEVARYHAAVRMGADERCIGRGVIAFPQDQMRLDLGFDLDDTVIGGKLPRQRRLEVEDRPVLPDDADVLGEVDVLFVEAEADALQEAVDHLDRRRLASAIIGDAEAADDDQLAAGVDEAVRPFGERQRIGHDVAGEPHQRAADALKVLVRRQRLAEVVIGHHQTEVVQRHLRDLVDLREADVGIEVAVVERQDRARHRLALRPGRSARRQDKQNDEGDGEPFHCFFGPGTRRSSSTVAT